MKKLAIALAAVIGMTSVAHADWRGPHRHYNGGYHGGYHGGYRGGGNDWAAPLVGGLIIGGMLGALSQPRYVQPQVYNSPQVYIDDEPQQVCYKRFAGRDYYGRPLYQTWCEYQ